MREISGSNATQWSGGYYYSLAQLFKVWPGEQFWPLGSFCTAHSQSGNRSLVIRQNAISCIVVIEFGE